MICYNINLKTDYQCMGLVAFDRLSESVSKTFTYVKGIIMLTQNRLLELLNYDKETGNFTWKESRGCIKKGSIAGHVTSYGYRKLKIDGINYFQHRLIYLYVFGYLPDEVDHINHIRNDNRLSNLQEANRALNCKNRYKDSRNTSGISGVSFNKAREKWMVRIGVNGKEKYLGLADTLEEAKIMRLNAEKEFGYSSTHGKDL